MKKWDFTDNKQSIIKAYHEELKAGSYDSIKDNYRDPATRYAFKVLDEKVLTSRTIKLDSFRHLQDLRRQTEDPEFKYFYDLDRARDIVEFASICPEVESGVPMPLADWQLAILCKIVAWRNKDLPEIPRFSDCIISVARTNGKSYIATILIAYYYLALINPPIGNRQEGDQNRDLTYLASTDKQTKKGWRYITATFNTLRKTRGFRKMFRERQIHNDKQKVEDAFQNSLMALTEASQVFNGFHFMLAVMDEAGSNEIPVHITAENKSAIISGFTQSHGQIVQISTAYPDSNSYLYSDEKIAIEAMEKDYERVLDNQLCMIWKQDSLDEVNDPETWIKSNPLFDLNEHKKKSMTETMIESRDKALVKGKLDEFENKNLNCWLQTKVDAYLDLKSIEKAVTKEPPIDIYGREVYVGLDISHSTDDTAVGFVFPYRDDEDGRVKFYCKQHSFVPLAHSQMNINIKSGTDNIDYSSAERRGYCTVMRKGRGYIDDDTVYKYIQKYLDDNHLDMKMFLYDPFDRSNMVMYILEKSGWTMLDVRQQPSSLDAPTRFFRKEIDEENIKIDDDPILQWSMKNAILVSSTAGVKIDKDKSTNKIDCMDALIDCFFLAKGWGDGLHGDLKEKDSDPFKFMSKSEQNNYLQDLINLNS